jgi:arylformamidase
VIEIKDKESVKVEEIANQKIKAGERVLFKTRNSKVAWATDSFYEDFVYISKEAAAFLAKAKVMTVGIDYLSVGGFRKDGIETHHALLGAGIWVIEGLNLAKIQPGKYELNCLPLKVLNSDGAPARALVR